MKNRLYHAIRDFLKIFSDVPITSKQKNNKLAWMKICFLDVYYGDVIELNCEKGKKYPKIT